MSEGHTRSALDQTIVARTIAGLPGWPHGPVHAERMIRIGAEHGLSGTAHRWRSRVADPDPILPRWQAEAWDDERWRDRLTRARSRFPQILSEAVVGRLRDLPALVAAAARTQAAGPASWIHSDAHLDNILWRERGGAVLLDWAGAMIGPPAVDAARFLVEGPPGVVSDEFRAAALIEAYQAQLRDDGVPETDVVLVPRAIELAVRPHAQSIVGWAGRPEDRSLEPRMERLRENALRGVVAWLDRETGGRFPV